MQSAISLVAAVAAATAQPSAYDQAQAMLAKGDVNRAIPLFEASAGQGNAAAAYNLGRIYSLGEGQAVNRGQALRWFHKAADEGNPGAAYQLGLAYREGLGVSRDSAAAARWFQKAANQGYADAEVRLGGLYARGQGVAEDRSEAARWYAAAAGHGDASARLDLALIDAEGRPAAPSPSAGSGQAAFRQSMNRVFGSGRWREAGGYRSPAREDQLRAQGALTVRRGQISHHSMGTPESPGAYDIVVAGLSPNEAAFRIRKSGIAFRRLFPEGVHGTQGPHLHVEPFLIKLRTVIGGREGERGPSQADRSLDAAPSPARDRAEALSLLSSAARRGDACAQNALLRGRGDGEAAARDYLASQSGGRCG